MATEKTFQTLSGRQIVLTFPDLGEDPTAEQFFLVKTRTGAGAASPPAMAAAAKSSYAPSPQTLSTGFDQ